MSQKHYIQFAKLFQQTSISISPKVGETGEITDSKDFLFYTILNGFIKICKNDNPLFNETKFIKYISAV